jgi:hypothetical protein
MDEYLIILRLVHIMCGVFWAGTLGFQAWFLIPAITQLGPEGGKFTQQLAKTRKFPIVMLTVAGLTILAGILLILKQSGGDAVWFESTPGKILSIGGSLAIIAFIIGISFNLPTVKRLTALGEAVAAAGGPPSPEQIAQMQKLRKRLFTAIQIIAGLLFVTVALMAVARYYV